MFDFIIYSSLRQRLLVMGIALFLIIYGVFTVRQMPVDVFVTEGLFIDIGIPEDYTRAQTLLAKVT